MKRFLNWSRRMPHNKPAPAKRSHTFRPQLEQLDERLVLSTLSSAISIPHPGGTERDWYTVDRSTYQVVEFQGMVRHNLGLYVDPSQAGLSASVDPKTGSGEVFVFANGGFYLSFGSSSLYLIDSAGRVYSLMEYSGLLSRSITGISATRDGHVYVATNGPLVSTTDVQYLDSNGSSTELGAPRPGLAYHPAGSFIQASVGWFGGNEVFVIGQDGAIYVNSSNTYGDWQLVDNRVSFTSLSATPNDTVFAVTSDGRLFQETEHLLARLYYFYWAGQDISGGRTYSVNISADTDASGGDEVYAIQNGTPNYLYLYDGGIWTLKDADVYDVSAAGGGYFYDVNYSRGDYHAYQYDPTLWWSHWSFLGSQLY
jgi:hypothetical protein